MNLSIEKIVFLLIVIILLALSFFQISQLYKRQTLAAAPKINIAINPASTSLAVNGIKTVIAIFTPQDATNKISGLDITLSAQGSIAVADIGVPSTFPGGDTSVFTQMLKTANRVVYLVQLPDPQLPSAVQLPIQIKGQSQGAGSLQIDTVSSKIVGNFPENVFEFGTVDSGSYTVGNPITPSPTTPQTLTPTTTLSPTNKPNPTPTPTSPITPIDSPIVTEPVATVTKTPNPSGEDGSEKESGSKDDEKEVEGDVDDDKDVDSIDYLYYTRAKKGYKVARHVKLDTDHDGKITDSDGEAIIRAIKAKRER